MPLDAEEQAEATALEAEERRRTSDAAGGLAGEINIHRQPQEIFPFVFALMLAPAIGGLGEPWMGIALAAVVVGLFLVHRARRRSRLLIDARGRLDVPGFGPVDWDAVRHLEVAYRYPFFSNDRERPHGETLAVRFTFNDGRQLKLARGPLWRRRPRREPLGCYRLERWLRACAREAGMHIERTDERAWRATRGR